MKSSSRSFLWCACACTAPLALLAESVSECFANSSDTPKSLAMRIIERFCGAP